MKATITDEHSLQRLLGALRTLFKEKGYLRVQASTDKPRSKPQNDLTFAYYSQIATEMGDTIEGVRCECKLRFGVPIMRRDDAEFRAAYDSVIKPLTYEQKLEAMRYWPVTSLMNTSQLTQYADDIAREYAKHCVVLQA